MSFKPIHIDCDPGSDDAIAILFALGAGVPVQSVSVVGGNADVTKCAYNALQILELAKVADRIPVYQGAAQPLKRLAQPLPEVFGESGMAGADLLPPNQTVDKQDAVNFLTTTDNLPSTLVALGPLTNLALAIQAKPELAKNIKDLVLMGGCARPEPLRGRLGNILVKGTTEYAEYNFAVDPEAAQIVFSAGINRITMIGLDITRSVLYNGTIDKILRARNGRVSNVVANILAYIGEEDRGDYANLATYPGEPIRAMHDVVAIAYVTNPDIFVVEHLPLKIVVGEPPLGSGQTLVDRVQPDAASVAVVKDLDRAKFYDLLCSYVGKLD